MDKNSLHGTFSYIDVYRKNVYPFFPTQRIPPFPVPTYKRTRFPLFSSHPKTSTRLPTLVYLHSFIYTRLLPSRRILLKHLHIINRHAFLYPCNCLPVLAPRFGRCREARREQGHRHGHLHSNRPRHQDLYLHRSCQSYRDLHRNKAC